MAKKTLKDKNSIQRGDIVYFTRHYAEWIKMLKGDIDISLIHRIARVAKVLDWDTEEGKLLLEQRENTGKWENLNSKDFKYVLKVYYPDLKGKGKTDPGISGYEVLPIFFPGTKYPLFEIYPKHLVEDLLKSEIEDPFRIEKKAG